MKKVKIRNIYYPDPSINWNFQSENPEAKIQELIDSQIIGLPERIVEQATCSEEQLANALELIPEVIGEDGILISPAMVKLPQDYTIEITDITQEIEMQKQSQEALQFLNESDFRVLRYIRQKALNLPLSLSEEEYLALEQQRHEASKKVIKV